MATQQCQRGLLQQCRLSATGGGAAAGVGLGAGMGMGAGMAGMIANAMTSASTIPPAMARLNCKVLMVWEFS